jgi:hypothetical protein
MKKSIFVVMILPFIFATFAYGQLWFNQPISRQTAIDKLESQPVCFTKNMGQLGDKTLFKAEAGGAAIYFCRDEVAYLFSRNTDKVEEVSPAKIAGLSNNLDNVRYNKESILIKAQFIGANLDVEVIGEDRLSYNCNYFYGSDQSRWYTDVPNYSVITYRNIWPGIDLRYHGNNLSLKYDFMVNPGADISLIRIRYEGVDNLSISNAGDLQAQTKFGLVSEFIPQIYQIIDGNKISISGQYSLIAPGVFGFAIGEYNSAYPVCIDPELVYSTYLGGTNVDNGFAVAIDASGNAYVTGQTYSYNFPEVNSYQSYYNGTDIFVSKLSGTGNSLLYSTYLGGVYDDVGYSIAVDSIGNAYVAGTTQSTNFPTVNAFDSSFNGGSDAIVAKLAPAGNSLLYSTYIGGTGTDYCRSMAINNTGNAIVTGFTLSHDFPMASAYIDSFMGGSTDAFISKLSAAGNSLEFSTYFGGNGSDYGFGIGYDNSGNSYISGTTGSLNLPLVDAYQDTLNGYFDVFIASFNPDGNNLRYSTYLGGTQSEQSMAMDVDNAGNVYIAGFTASTDFPLANAFDPTYNSDYEDAFVSKLSWGNSIIYSTYLGGYYEDQAWGISVDGSGCAYATGYTYATDFPVANPFDSAANGNADIFVTKFNPSGVSLGYSTYLGALGNEYGRGIAVDNMGNATIVGYSTSSGYPKVNAYDSTFNGSDDVVVSRFAAASGIEDNQAMIPSSYQLYQNYPNPFNARTQITFFVPKSGIVTLEIFDILGNKVQTLVDKDMSEGKYTALWDATNQASGVYFYRIKTGDYNSAKKMLFLK